MIGFSDYDFTASLLLLEDDEVFRQRLARALRERKYDVTEVGDLPSGLEAVEGKSFEYAVVDLRVPGGSGLELVRAAIARNKSINIVVLTGFGSIATAIAAVRLGASDYLTKPADVDDILHAFGRDRSLPVSPQAAMPESLPSLARVEWEYLNRVLSEVEGNVSEAARRLGLHRRSLQRKLAKLPPRQ